MFFDHREIDASINFEIYKILLANEMKKEE